MKKKMEVRAVTGNQAVPWFLKKHYAKRIPSVSWVFGLYLDGNLEGIVSYGTPASTTLLSGVCGKENADKVIELNRLVLNEGLQKNSASYLVGNSLKLLPLPKIVISYADTKQNHIGYIYQACNFIYTGLSSKFLDPKIKGLEHQHHATYAHGMTNKQLREKFGDKLYFEERARKHRYVFFAGCPKLKEQLKYKIYAYPKGETKRYDSGGTLPVQSLLF